MRAHVRLCEFHGCRINVFSEMILIFRMQRRQRRRDAVHFSRWQMQMLAHCTTALHFVSFMLLVKFISTPIPPPTFFFLPFSSQLNKLMRHQKRVCVSLARWQCQRSNFNKVLILNKFIEVFRCECGKHKFLNAPALFTCLPENSTENEARFYSRK